MGLAGSTSGGTVDGGGGNDTLILDYSGYETGIQNVESSSYVERIDNDVDLIYLYDTESVQITGTEFDDSLIGLSNSDTLVGGAGNDDIRGNGNDSLDGGEGTDKLSLDFSLETQPLALDLTDIDNQVDFANTQVKNFEEIGTIYTSSHNDRIQLGLAGSTSGGTVDGGGGNDTLILDYSGYETGIQNVESSSYVERIDNDVDLIYFYDIESIQITGTEFDDSLRGLSNSDTLVGGAGDDSIQGNSGNDILVGVNLNLENAGADEIDTLVGGANSDQFFLGNLNQAFYNDGNSNQEGIEDYALITDFNPSEDTIELSGTKTNYRLDISPIDDIRAGLFHAKSNAPRN